MTIKKRINCPVCWKDHEGEVGNGHPNPEQHIEWMEHGVPFEKPFDPARKTYLENDGLIWVTPGFPEYFSKPIRDFLLIFCDRSLARECFPDDRSALIFIKQGRIVGFVSLVNYRATVGLGIYSWVIPSMRDYLQLDQFIGDGRGYTTIFPQALKNSIINEVKETITRDFGKESYI